ncbi:WD40-repeat-containing domain protein [Neohortaea acidophila]|uniref:WD40-repeat-containing domain protein n=1 Tax=Neohortaea acidophila TaxID=245834 RepID=A0A6A6PUI4_9PEZI|nr:WD40-repeat-containing domain protein [Neohortaea acidophila]KAF2483652.1 WD40-repeat-containing domain protein [Neohortaea acidophila]
MSTAPAFPTTRLTTLQPPTNSPIHALTYSSGTGQFLLTGSADRQIRLYNPTSTKRPLIQTYAAHGYEVLDLAVSADNSRFASVGGDKLVFLWDVSTAQTTRRFGGHAGRVNAVCFGGEDSGGAGESVVVSGSFDGTVKVWDLRSRSEKAIVTFAEARDSVSCVRVVGGEIYAGSVDGKVRVYDLALGCVDVDVLGASVTAVTPAKAGDSYLVSTLDNKLRLMDRTQGKCLQTFEHTGFKNDTYRVRSTLAMADAYAVSGAENGKVCVWDVLSGELKEELWHMEGEEAKEATKKSVVSAVAWNQMRKQLASAGGDGTVAVWGVSE